MAHLRSTSYYQDSHDDYASSSSSYRQPYHDRSLHLPKTERRGRPAYTTVRPFIIDSRDSPVARSHDTMAHDLNRHVGDYVADRLVPTMLRSSDRPVEVFMNFGDAKLALPDTDPRLVHGLERNRSSSRVPNAIIYNAPGCSFTLDDRRCGRYCDHCEMVERDHRGRDRDRHHHLHRRNMELDHPHGGGHHDRQPRSRSHVHIISHSRNPSPSPLPLHVLNRDRHYHLDRGLDLDHVGRHRDRHPRSRSQHVRVTSSYSGSRNPSPSVPLPLPGLFPIATAVEKATHSSRSQHRGGSQVCPGCLIKTTVYRDGYCVDCDPPTYTSSSRRVDATPSPVHRERGHGTRVRYTRDQVIGDGSSSDDSWARVEVASRDSGRYRARSRGRDRGGVYDVLTDSRGYGDSRRRGGSRWEKERRLTPRYSGYVSESDV